MNACVLALAVVMGCTQLNAQALLRSANDAAPAVGVAPRTAPVDSAPSTTFRAGIDLVALNVVVTDGHDKLITGLAPNDFAVFEDGMQQDLSFFAATAIPLDLAILLDTSASMSDKMKTMQDAAVGFASSLHEGDRISIVDIKESVKIVHKLDEDVEGARAAIRETTSKGGTALYNGVYLALREMMKERRSTGDVRRQAIAVLSDGDDTASLLSFDDVMEVAKQAGIAVYTMTLRSPYAVKHTAQSGQRYFSNAGFTMRALARETGARAFFPTDISQIAGVYDVIAQELASQYALGYTSKNLRRDGAFRRVIVRVATPGLRTRTRSGYQSARIEHASLR